MTTIPPRRRQQSLRLDGAWLLTQSSEGTREIPGMSVVADSRGFTIAGPESGNERTVAWEQTTGFTCQRPARLPDGSPATVLEVGLANGRVLELLLPVTRVPPSETVVVETELVVMSEMYGGGKPRPTAQAQGTPEQVEEPAIERSAPVAPTQPPLSSQSPRSAHAPDSNGSNGSNGSKGSNNGSNGSNGSNGTQGRKSRTIQREDNTDGDLSEVLISETPEQVGALARNGSRSNGNRVAGSSKLATGMSIAPRAVMPASPVSDLQVDSDPTDLVAESDASSAQAVADPVLDAGQADKADVVSEPAAEPSSEADSVLADESDPDSATASHELGLSQPEDTELEETELADIELEDAASGDIALQDTDLEVAELEETELADIELEDSELEDHELVDTDSEDVAEVGSNDRRQSRMFNLLVALIGVVVVVLIAELMLILFVLNHNSSSRQSLPSHGQTTLIVYGAARPSPNSSV